MENTIVMEQAECKAPEHKQVFNADFALIASTVSAVYTFLMVFGMQML